MSVGRAAGLGALHKPMRQRTISLANIVLPTDVESATSLNEAADVSTWITKELARHFDRIHSENHTTNGQYNLWCGGKNKGASSTTLGYKLGEVGVRTSVYGHGSYVMQARPEEAPDLEANYPLAIAVFWPGNPDDDRTPERLLYDLETGRDERGFEGNNMQYWNARAPVGATAQLVDSTTPGIGTEPRTGNQCLAVTRGASAGQVLVSTGLTVGTAKSVTPGTLVPFSVWTKAQSTPRSTQAEIRWMNSAYETLSTISGTPSTNDTSIWTEMTVSGVAPEGAAYYACQVRWLGPPAQGETHYIDDATSASLGGRLTGPVDSSQTTIAIWSASALKPDAGLPNTWPFRAPRTSDPNVTAGQVSTATDECVHWVRVGDEIMGITASSENLGIVTLSVVRGMWGTTAAAHSSNAKVFSPVYVGSISEGADATFAGSPAVNDPTKAVRYSLALEQRLDLAQQKRATEWMAKRRTMEILEFDREGNPNGVPLDSSPLSWATYTEAGIDRESVDSVYLDITGTSFYNMSDSYGYNVTPWTLVGVPDAGVAGDQMMTSLSLSHAQINKVDDMRAYMNDVGLFSDAYIIGNNLAMQSNSQDADKQAIVASGSLNLAVFEFWINKPNLQPAKYLLQRDQFLTCCAEDLPVCVWAKSGQNGLVGTPFDSSPTGSGNISAEDLAHYRRWTYAHFLMGWRGSTRQQYLTEWSLNYNSTMSEVFMSYLGKPIGSPSSWADLSTSGGLKYRDYTFGRVYVNDTGSSVELTLPRTMRDLVEENHPFVGGKVIQAWDAGIFYAP